MCQQGRLEKQAQKTHLQHREPCLTQQNVHCLNAPHPLVTEKNNINTDKSASDFSPAIVITFNAGVSFGFILCATSWTCLQYDKTSSLIVEKKTQRGLVESEEQGGTVGTVGADLELRRFLDLKQHRAL